MSFPRYQKYKDSGVEWLGEVPAHWSVQPIKRLLRSIEQGWSPQCEGLPAEPGEWGVLKVGCVNGGRFNAGENKALPDSLDPVPALAIKRGDVLVSRANTRDLVGGVAVAREDHDKLLLCDKLYRLRADERRCEPEFLALYLAASTARSVIEAAATGASSSMLNIGQGAIVGMQIVLPPHDEQRAMLSFLGVETAKIDALVEEQKRLIELLKEKRQAVISHAVTKGLNSNAPMRDSGVEWLGEVPAHWGAGALTRIADRIVVGIAEATTHAYADEGIAILRSTNVRAGKIIGDILYVTPEFAEGRGTKLMHVGDLVTVRTGNAGVTAVVPLGLDGCQCFTMLITTLSRLGLPAFYCYTLNSVPSQRYFALEGWGTAQVNISVPILKALPVAIPPVDEQQAIVNYLDAATAKFDELLAGAEAAAILLSERRSALISAAVTGKIDVRSRTQLKAA